MKSAVIIGGGIGGLFTGAILSKEGMEVTVVEKNTTAGGGLQSFTRFGEVFDTGMHVFGGMVEGGSVRRVCEYLGIWDKVKVRNVDANCSTRLYYSEDGRFYDIASGKDGFIDSLSYYFPDEKENLKAYVEAMKSLTEEMDLFYLRHNTRDIFNHSDEFWMPANKFVEKYIGNEHLRSIVSYLTPLYAGRENMTPAYVHSILSTLFINGQSRLVGGSSRLAEALCECIQQNGGTVLTGDAVEKIHTEDGRVTSITTHSGRVINADWFISDIHPCLLTRLLDNPKVLPKVYRNRLDEIPNTYSAFTLSIKMKPETFRYMDYSAFYMKRYDEVWHYGNDDDLWPRGFLYMTPPVDDQGEYSTKLIVTVPMIWDKVSCWENTKVGHRGDDYEKWKSHCADLVLDCLEEIYPGFRENIVAIDTASPLTIRDYYGSKEGGMFGYAKDSNNILFSQLSVQTKIPNLLLTGQNVNLHGMCGVTLTAVSTSETILGENNIIDKL